MGNIEDYVKNTDNVIKSLFRVFKQLCIDFWRKIRELCFTYARIIKDHKDKKLAIFIVLSITLIPWLVQIKDMAFSTYSYVDNLVYWEERVNELRTDNNQSVIDFFQTYNNKYGVDCDWIREVNVDMNMYFLYNTRKKPGKGCLTNEKWQIIPLEIRTPIIDNVQQTARVQGDALINIIRDGSIYKIEQKRFELWRKLEWENGYWHFNPFSSGNTVKYYP